MISPLQCQARCFNNADCDYFAYEWELTAGEMYHECYLKTEYDDAQCMVNPYVPWASEDSQWHGQSGPGIACATVGPKVRLRLAPSPPVLVPRTAKPSASRH